MGAPIGRGKGACTSNSNGFCDVFRRESLEGNFDGDDADAAAPDKSDSADVNDVLLISRLCRFVGLRERCDFFGDSSFTDIPIASDELEVVEKEVRDGEEDEAEVDNDAATPAEPSFSSPSSSSTTARPSTSPILSLVLLFRAKLVP